MPIVSEALLVFHMRRSIRHEHTLAQLSPEVAGPNVSQACARAAQRAALCTALGNIVLQKAGVRGGVGSLRKRAFM